MIDRYKAVDSRVRRCWSFVCEPVDLFSLDMVGLISGGGQPLLVRELKWNVLAAHLDAPVLLEPEQLELLVGVDRDEWVALSSLSESVCFLVEIGLLIKEADDGGFSQRDQQLREGRWWTPAAVLHAQSRWQGMDSIQELAERGMDRLDGLIDALGVPPPSGNADGVVHQLPAAENSSLEILLSRRVSCRNFDGDAYVDIEQLSSVLWSGLGERAAMLHASGARFSKKGCPSAGGLHPVEAYLMLRNVRGMADGLYHYQADKHRLLSLTSKQEVCRQMAMRWVAGQYWFADAQVLVVLAPRFDRLLWKYQKHLKAYRAATLDVGHLSQAMYLSATENGLGCFVTAAINEIDIENDICLQPFGDGPMAIFGFGVRSQEMCVAELDPDSKIWKSV